MILQLTIKYLQLQKQHRCVY